MAKSIQIMVAKAVWCRGEKLSMAALREAYRQAKRTTPLGRVESDVLWHLLCVRLNKSEK